VGGARRPRASLFVRRLYGRPANAVIQTEVQPDGEQVKQKAIVLLASFVARGTQTMFRSRYLNHSHAIPVCKCVTHAISSHSLSAVHGNASCFLLIITETGREKSACFGISLTRWWGDGTQAPRGDVRAWG